jgi:hypothetical protein
MRRHKFQGAALFGRHFGIKAVLNNLPDIRAREFRSLRPPFGAAFLSWGSTLLRPA